jgi:hypothetical protein
MKFHLAIATLAAVSSAGVSGFSTAPRPQAFTSASSQTQRFMVGTLEAPTVATTKAESNDVPLPLAPLTLWGEPIEDIVQAQKKLNKLPKAAFPATIDCIKDAGLKSDDVDGQLNYMKENAMAIKTKMQDSGAVVFRNFDLMKSQDGFQEFYKAVGMHVCLDPLHSVSARPTVDGKKNSPVYEAVNKESRKNFFIGEYLQHTSSCLGDAVQ